MPKFIFFLMLILGRTLVAGNIVNHELPIEFIVKVGEKVQISKSSDSIWIEDPSLVKIDDLGTKLRIQSLKSGSSEIRISNQSTMFHVLQKSDYALFENLKSESKKIIGLKLKIQRGKVNIVGSLYSIDDYKNISTLCQKYQARFVFLASIHEKIQEPLVQFINAELKKASLHPQSIQFNNGIQIYLNESDSDFDRFDKFGQKFGIQITKIKKAVETAPTVKVQITIAEVKKDKKLQWGVQWPSNYSAKILSPSTVMNELIFDAKAFETQGYGKILASPNLLCRSGSEAEFWAGGEFPIKIFNQKVQDVVWKKYGIILKVKPIADASGRMHIQLESEVSSIDQSQSIDGIPGMLTDKVSSFFDLNESRTIAISGLIKNTDGKSTEGLPFLSQIPILGALFSSQDYKENRTELVIFVKPSIYDENQNLNQPPNHITDL